MAGNIKGIIVEIGGDTSALQKSLSSLNSATSSLSKELRGINSLLKLDPKNTELLSQKQEVLAENIEQTSRKLQDLRNIQEKANEDMSKISPENYRNLQREIANTEQKLKQLILEASNWTKAGKSLEQFGNKVTSIASKIDNLGNTLTTSLTLPVLAIGTAAITTGNDFEKQMSRVQAIAGATESELEQLTNQAIELGAETSFSASEVAAGMENLASAGFTTNEIMKAMPGLLDLAASSGAELATASEIAASAIRGFGLEADQAGHVADIFAEAAARTNAQTEDMGEAMKYVAPVAKTVGLSIEETAAAIGIMSDAGVKGSQAGTTLRGGLTRIVKPTKMVRDAMEELGVEFYDSNGKMKSLTEIIKTLQEHTKGLTDETKNQALAQIFGTEALSGMLALVNRGSNELADMTKSFKNCDGAAEEMADTMLDNTAGAFESLSGSLESAGIAIQKELAPYIRDLAEWIQELVDEFVDLSDEEKKNVIRTAALVAAIGPAVKIIGKLGSGIGTAIKDVGLLSQAIGVVKSGAKSTSSEVNTLATVISAIKSPVGLAVTALTALAAATAYVIKKGQELDPEVQKATDSINKMTEAYNESNNAAQEQISAGVAEMDYIQRLREELTQLVDANGKVKDGYKERVDFILGQLNEALGTEYTQTDGIIQKYKELTESIDLLIQKKKAEVVLDANKDNYANALTERTKAQTEYSNNLSKQIELEDELTELRGKLTEATNKQTEAEEKGQTGAYSAYETYKNQAQFYKTQIDQKTKDLEAQKQNVQSSLDLYKKYTEIIGADDKLQTALLSNNTEIIKNALQERTNSIVQQSMITNDNLAQQIEREGTLYQSDLALKQNYVAQNQLENAKLVEDDMAAGQQRLTNLASQLVEETSKVTELTPAQVEAWKSLANASFLEYCNGIAKMSPEMQQQIQNATGIVAANTPKFASQAGEMGTKVAEEFDKNAEAKEKALNTLQGFYEGLNDQEKKELLKTTVGDRADEVAAEFDKGDYQTSGENVLTGLYNGLNNGTLGQSLINKAASIAKNIAAQFNIQWDEHSPSKLMKKMAENFLLPISTVFDKKKRGLTNDAKRLAGGIANSFGNNFNTGIDLGSIPKLQSGLTSAVKQASNINYYNNITFNVQELDRERLEQCFDFINKKYGSMYS